MLDKSDSGIEERNVGIIARLARPRNNTILLVGVGSQRDQSFASFLVRSVSVYLDRIESVGNRLNKYQDSVYRQLVLKL